MLNEQQIEQLELLTNHPKFGKLLLAAMETWKSDNNPKITYWGIRISDDFDSYIENGAGCSCLLGASLLNKNHNECEDYFGSVRRIYNLDETEPMELMAGFDSKYENVGRTEAFNFAAKIAMIVDA